MEDYLPLITGSGGAIVVLAITCFLLITGKIHSDREFTRLEQENAELKTANDRLRYALDTERGSLNATAAAGQVTNQLLGALAAIAGGYPPAHLPVPGVPSASSAAPSVPPSEGAAP